MNSEKLYLQRYPVQALIFLDEISCCVIIRERLVQAASEDDAFVSVSVNVGANKGYSFKTHPNIDKNLYNAQNILALRDPERPFPSGSPVGILKWRMQARTQLHPHCICDESRQSAGVFSFC